MSFAGPSKSCPRCNAVLPAQATFCGTCGLQFPAAPPAPPQSAPSGGSYGPTQYAGPGAPGGWAQSQPQPGYAPQGQPPYGAAFAPQGQPGFAGYAAAPVAAPPRKGGAGKAIILILVLVVLVGGGAAAWFLLLHPGPGSPFFDRHGLQSNVPLPNGTAFSGLKKTFSSTDPDTHITISADAWGWTVSGSDAVAVQKFYKDNLGSKGWTKINAFNGDQGQKDVSACQGGQVLIIGASSTKLEVTDDNGKVTDTITAPSGGSALITELSSSPAVVQLLCSGASAITAP
jgi:hypothetical protein